MKLSGEESQGLLLLGGFGLLLLLLGALLLGVS